MARRKDMVVPAPDQERWHAELGKPVLDTDAAAKLGHPGNRAERREVSRAILRPREERAVVGNALVAPGRLHAAGAPQIPSPESADGGRIHLPQGAGRPAQRQLSETPSEQDAIGEHAPRRADTER